jgi:hypothetical protein
LKIKSHPNINIKIEEIEETEEIEKNNKPTIKSTYEHNSDVAQIKIPSMNLEGLEINYYNRNIDCFSDKGPVYPLDTNSDGKFDEFNKFLLEGKKNKAFNLEKYFKYVLRRKYDYGENDKIDKTDLENYILTPIYGIGLENVSITNCIIFGESNIRFSDVEKLLSLIRFDNEY